MAREHIQFNMTQHTKHFCLKICVVHKLAIFNLNEKSPWFYTIYVNEQHQVVIVIKINHYKNKFVMKVTAAFDISRKQLGCIQSTLVHCILNSSVV